MIGMLESNRIIFKISHSDINYGVYLLGKHIHVHLGLFTRPKNIGLKAILRKLSAFLSHACSEERVLVATCFGLEVTNFLMRVRGYV